MRKLMVITMLILAIVAAVITPFIESNVPSEPGDIDRLLFFPEKYPLGNWNPKDLQYQDVYFTSVDNTRLHGWYCPVKDSVATILFAHGNAGHVGSRAALLQRLQSNLNVSVFIFDYRGYGRSEGVPSIDDVLQDAQAARGKLRELAQIDDADMLLMGESLGGALMVELAAESDPLGLILQSTFSSLRDVADVHYPQHSWRVPPTVLNSASKIAHVRVPLLQSHGARDQVIPLASAEKLFQAANEPKHLMTITDADHNNTLTDEYFQRLGQFVRSFDRSPVSESR